MSATPPPGKLHARIQDLNGRFRADCWIEQGVSSPPEIVAIPTRDFTTLEDARVWIEQQSHERGYDRVWMEH